MQTGDEQTLWEEQNKKKVFTLGVFDMFHIGHLNIIEQAAELGNLTVGVVEDKAVSRVKGSSRPIINQWDRVRIVGALEDVKAVVLVDDFCIPESVIEEWDIIVVGADQHHVKGIDKIPINKRHNLPRTEGVSTTELAKKLKG